jgi:ubiquinone/menaquinone biosynthesis C-methylase UbiE
MRGMEQRPAVYDAVVGPMDAARLGRWRRRMFGDLRGAILEIGVGTGLNLRAYGPDATITALEIDRELLWAARDRADERGATVVQADAERLPFAAGSFDIVTSALVFCTIPNPAAALVEVARVLRPGGRLVQIEHTRTNTAFDVALSAATPLWKRVTGGCHLDRDTPALLQALGWRLTRNERHLGGLFRLLEATRPPA